MIDLKRRYFVDYNGILAKHPEFILGFTEKNLTKGISMSSIFNYVDPRIFMMTKVIPLPLQKGEFIEFDFSVKRFSAQSPEVSHSEELYKLGLLFLFGTCYVDIENVSQNPIGVSLSNHQLAVLGHKEQGRIIEIWTMPTNSEYFELKDSHDNFDATSVDDIHASR